MAATPRPANENNFTSHLLRTSTPAPDEKVLMYLETMRAAEGVDGDTILSPKSRLSALPRSQLSGASRPRNGHAIYADDDGEDVASDVQEQSQSILGSLVQREPGPEDEPGPHYESYGSSWGNFGPMPPDSATEGTPNKAVGVPLPNSTLAQSTTKVRSSRAGSRASASQKEPSTMSKTRATEEDAGTALDGVSKVKSQMTGYPNGDGRPTSPRSRMSHDQSPPSRITRSEKPPTVYPPLPESRSGSNLGSVSQVKSRKAHSRAPSLSPSDSPSNYKPPRPVQKPAAKEPTLPPLPSISGSELESVSKIRPAQNGDVRSQPGPSVLSGGARSHRPFSPYRNAPTNQDLLHAAVHGQRSGNGSVQGSRRGGNGTASASGIQSPDELNDAEQEMVRDILRHGGPATNRASYAATSVLEPNQVSHFHDMDLCILLHQLEDPTLHDVVKKAVKKAVKARVKQLGLKYDNETIKEYRKSFHDHNPSVHLQPNYQPHIPPPQEQPEWAKTIIQQMEGLQQQVATLGPKIDGLLSTPSSSAAHRYYPQGESEMAYAQTPATQTIHITTNPTGTIGEGSMYQPATDMMVESSQGHAVHPDDEDYDDDEDEGTETGRRTAQGMESTQGDTHTRGISDYTAGHRDSPGQQYLEEELYKLRIRPGDSHSAVTHKTWELARDDGEEYDEEGGDAQAAITESGMPEIPDSQGGFTRPTSPPAPSEGGGSRRDVGPPADDQVWQGQVAPSDYNSEPPAPPPWQRIHQRLLNWAIVWPLSELDNALNSTTRGNQVDEVALSIWSTQTYKRYVRSKMTDSPPGRVDRLFVPPNMADAISNAVFNGRHGDASGMLRELWHPFGLEGMPRLLIVLAKHRTDANHWVVHRFSLPDGTLTTYDSYPERCLPDGRPLGWWFAIRIAWPSAIYPSPDHLMQKMVRLHRPMQLGIDNSVAAAGIWRNLLMGSRAERNLDLARLRDLINTETANLRQRKLMGKLTIGAPRANWEDMS